MGGEGARELGRRHGVWLWRSMCDIRWVEAGCDRLRPFLSQIYGSKARLYTIGCTPLK